MWGKLAPNMKHAMLKGKISNSKSNNRFSKNIFNNPSCKTIKPPSCNPKPFTKANLHELLHELIVESNQSEDDDSVTEDTEEKNDSTFLVNSAISNKFNPGDIRKLLPAFNTGTSTPSSTNEIVNKSEINVNGKIYQQVVKHFVCFLSKGSRSS